MTKASVWFGSKVALALVCLWWVGGCNVGGGGGGNANAPGNENVNDNVSVPDEFEAADAVRGGTLYDKWWAEAGVDQPTEDHPLWDTRPDMVSNTRTGADTWRCKECHGWDYKGKDGVYAEGSHATGFDGIFGTTRSAQEVFDLLTAPEGHAFDTSGLSNDDIWDLAKFVLEGVVDTDDMLDGAAFTGSADAGQPLFDTCAGCHGPDGLTPPPGAPEDFDDFPGKLADENPWEFQHKVRFGQPGTTMPAQADILSIDQVADLGAHAQTLPTSPEDGGDGGGGDAAAGEEFFAGDNASAVNCSLCHCADAGGGCLPGAPSLVGEESSEILEHLDGTEGHTGGTVEGVTQQDADDLAAWLATL